MANGGGNLAKKSRKSDDPHSQNDEEILVLQRYFSKSYGKCGIALTLILVQT